MTLPLRTADHPSMGICMKENENTGVALKMPDQIKKLLVLKEIHKHWIEMRARTGANLIRR